TWYGPDADAVLAMVPEITPVAESMLRPPGCPVAVNVRGSPSGSAASTRNDTAPPSVPSWSPGLARSMCETVQANDRLWLDAPWAAVTVTAYGLLFEERFARVPEIRPVVLLIVRPAGSPVAP